MFDLLKIEWLKIRKYKTLWIILCLFLALLAFSSYFVISGIMESGEKKGVHVLGADYSFSNVWNKVSYITKVFSGLLAIVIVILTTNEYQFRTNRQNIIDGWKKTDFFHAKWLLVVIFSLLVTFYAFLQGLCFGLIGGSPISGISNNLDTLIYVFVLALNYFGLALTLSLFLKRSGFTIIIFLVYAYIGELLIDKLLSNKLHTQIGKLLPMDASANLIPVAKMEAMTSMMIKGGYSTNTLLIASFAWIAVYYMAGRWKLLKTDW